MGRRQKLGERGSRHDEAYKRAKAEGYAGRAIFKLEELDKKFRLLGRGKKVLDLGCWPGSWMQYTWNRVSDEGFVLGIDKRRIEIDLPEHAKSAVADVEVLEPSSVFERFGEFDVVLSDMAPQTTGDRASDQYRSETLARRAMAYATCVLRPGGHFAAKILIGGGFKTLLQDMREVFSEVRAFHPKSTRAGSTEQYVVGRGLKANARPPRDSS